MSVLKMIGLQRDHTSGMPDVIPDLHILAHAGVGQTVQRGQASLQLSVRGCPELRVVMCVRDQ